MFTGGTHVTELNQMAEEAKRRAEIARYLYVLNYYFMQLYTHNYITKKVLA